MTTPQIAARLAELCSKGDFETAQKELYANDAVSIEPHPTPDFAHTTKGLDAILEKGKKWNGMLQEAHGMHLSEPVIAGSSFALTLTMDVTMKGGPRMTMAELCVYQVKDGKIVSEAFFM